MREIVASTRVTGRRRWASVEAARRKVKDDGPYLIRRHGGFFRPEAQGYTENVTHAGLFTPDQARSYLDVEGLSVMPLWSMKERLSSNLAQAESDAIALRVLLDVASAT